MSEWQPIETAPKNKRFLAVDKERAQYDDGWAVCDYNGYGGYLNVCGVGGYEIETDIRPTHWMPLPEPPK